MEPLILTLKLDAASFRFFDCLRREHFPIERNFLPAHLTLFHKLPGAQIETLKDDLRRETHNCQSLSLVFSRWRFLGRGVAAAVESAELVALRLRLAAKWTEWLGRQDAQKFQPHVTVQNKAAPDEARELYERLSATVGLSAGTGEGLLLWHYLNPRWRLEEEFLFGGREAD